MKKVIATIIVIIFVGVFVSQTTFFIIQPIGAIPEGRTLLILRTNKTKFIDSADAICEREMGGVSLLCRGTMLGAIANKSHILLKLPYSETLYKLSTSGKEY